MTRYKLRSFFTYFIIISKILILMILFAHWLTSGLHIDEMKSIIQIIIPLFGLHISTIIKKGLINKADNTEVLSRSATFLHLIIPISYVLLLFVIVNLRPLGIISPDNFSDLESLLVLCEMIFGVYFGQIIMNVFHSPTNKKADQ
ncbi:hypothetical protein [Ekhidna sp.]|uniref:hypothetical protein n=1 Tax=Ekhidna sp. TaxID=2608089 RepID=UPI003BABCB1D